MANRQRAVEKGGLHFQPPTPTREIRTARCYNATVKPEEIEKRLREMLGERIGEGYARDKHPRVHVQAQHWREVAEFLLRDPQLQMNWLANLSGVDYAADDKMAAVYELWSFDLRHAFAVKVFTPRQQPSIPTVSDLWPAANWHEREAFDLLGIDFPGHPDLRRILCADDWEGFPLRKDYIFPREYHGIPGSVELDWQQQSK
jgi:NADH-quinone oxidoreductase subunit C